ncbi:unnamed protein product [Kluyveromyces dobzhanskii CBS 2104]|uniref:WGS project CCBQ000000000 data, contig 00099 n=1 Tax=Kluyveromyces dobzhanskii CBS 2104 TaxID=1427455 RepID=A0A0A8L2A2_9SACH|nr:unnamed protein product [Kluyveromyces dobzhanskii CBS 2104]
MNDDNECKLLGPVSIAIQMLMAFVILCSLLLKRQSEHPKRTWVVWFYDVGKQVLGALSIHFLNVVLSVLKGNDSVNNVIVFILPHTVGSGVEKNGTDTGDECDWFFLNLLLDTTVGIPILWCCLTFLEYVLMSIGIENIESGNYYSKLESHSANSKREPLFSAFLKQLAVFIAGLVLMKICLFLVLLYFENVAEWLANWVLGWSDPWPNLQVFLVMFVFPLLLNCFQCFCVDSIIKLPATKINAQNLDNFDQESLVQRDGLYISASSKRYGTVA